MWNIQGTAEQYLCSRTGTYQQLNLNWWMGSLSALLALDYKYKKCFLRCTIKHWLHLKSLCFHLQSSKDRLDVKSVMETWVSEAGYPVVTVTRQDAKVHISQQRFSFFNNQGFQSGIKYLRKQSIFISLVYIFIRTKTLPVSIMHYEGTFKH